MSPFKFGLIAAAWLLMVSALIGTSYVCGYIKGKEIMRDYYVLKVAP